MAWALKDAENMQIFRGSKPAADVFTKSLIEGADCCPTDTVIAYDKLARRVRFDNGLSHLNPLGGNEKFRVPIGSGFTSQMHDIVAHINEFGVGAQISVIAIPTYAYLTGVGVHVEAMETGLTFSLVTRNGLVLPSGLVDIVDVTGDVCAPIRTRTAGSAASFVSFGALGAGVHMRDIFGRSALGEFSLEADELILEVTAIPVTPVTGAFDITVSVNYELINRAEI